MTVHFPRPTLSIPYSANTLQLHVGDAARVYKTTCTRTVKLMTRTSHQNLSHDAVYHPCPSLLETCFHRTEVLTQADTPSSKTLSSTMMPLTEPDLCEGGRHHRKKTDHLSLRLCAAMGRRPPSRQCKQHLQLLGRGAPKARKVLSEVLLHLKTRRSILPPMTTTRMGQGARGHAGQSLRGPPTRDHWPGLMR